MSRASNPNHNSKKYTEKITRNHHNKTSIRHILIKLYRKSFSGGSDGEESTCNVGDLGLIPGLGRSPEGGNGNPLQYSCLENPMDREAWQATVHDVARVGHDYMGKGYPLQYSYLENPMDTGA